MSIKTKIAALACASALALAGAVPAFAADSTTVNKADGTADVKISAAVAKENEKIISVTMPSQLAIGIVTNASDGKFKEYKVVNADVQNHDVSTNHVSVSIANVSQTAGVDHNGKLLDLVDLKLAGDAGTAVALKEGAATDVLFADIAPGGSSTLMLSAEKNAANAEIPTDAYTVSTTLKVTAL